MKRVNREPDGKFTKKGRTFEPHVYPGTQSKARTQTRSRGIKLDRETRLKVLEFLTEHGGDQQLACREFKLDPRTVGRVAAWNVHRTTTPFKAKVLAELGLRQRLYEKSVRTLEEFAAPVDKVMGKFITETPIPNPEEHVSTYMAARGKQADTAVKLLYGLPEALKAQGETKHSGTVEVEAKVAVLVANLAEGRKRVAALRGNVLSSPKGKTIDLKAEGPERSRRADADSRSPGN